LSLYDEQTYEEYMDTFDMLPISGVVNGRYLAMHGGIS
jgi:serine/threonine-protein phosphatase 2B catalytic subunit